MLLFFLFTERCHGVKTPCWNTKPAKRV